MSVSLIEDIALLIIKDMGMLEVPALPTTNEEEAWKKLRSIMAERIDNLLQNDIEQLKVLLYRLDINEQKVKQVLAEAPVGEAAGQIAELILIREIEKAHTRRQYRAGSGDWLDV